MIEVYSSITQSDEPKKASVGMYYTYVLIISIYYSCLFAFSTAIPTSLFNFKQLFFILVINTVDRIG